MAEFQHAMSCILGQASSGGAFRWVLEQPFWLRLLGSAVIILALSAVVNAVLALARREPRKPGNIALSVGIATALALVVWSRLTHSGSMAVYQLFGGAIVLVVWAVAVPNRVEVLDWISARVGRLSYRIVYVALALLLALPFVVGQWAVKPQPRAITRGLYDAIEKCAETGKPVFLLNAWIMDSRGENQPQFECIVDHLMRRRVKFVMLSFFPDTAIVGRSLCQRIERYYNEKYGEDYLKYGRDWLMLGYKPVYWTGGWPAWVPNMKSKGIAGSFETDYMGKDLRTYPIMARPKAALREEGSEGESAPTEGDAGTEPEGQEEPTTGEKGLDAANYLQLGDFGLILEIHYTGTVEQIIGLIRLDKELAGPDGRPKIEVGLGTVNMVVNQMLPYYDTGDLCGILAGFQGAAEYSQLLEDEYGEGPSREGVKQRSNAFSMGVLFVLSVIIVGNLCTLWKALAHRREARAVD